MGKRKTEEPDLLKPIFEAEAKKKKTKTTKKGDHSMKTIITVVTVTVLVTLAVVGAFVFTYFLGVNHEAEKQREVRAKVQSAVKEAVAKPKQELK